MRPKKLYLCEIGDFIHMKRNQVLNKTINAISCFKFGINIAEVRLY